MIGMLSQTFSVYIYIYLGGTSQVRRGQLRASSGGSSGDTSKTSFPFHNLRVKYKRYYMTGHSSCIYEPEKKATCVKQASSGTLEG